MVQAAVGGAEPGVVPGAVTAARPGPATEAAEGDAAAIAAGAPSTNDGGPCIGALLDGLAPNMPGDEGLEEGARGTPPPLPPRALGVFIGAVA